MNLLKSAVQFELDSFFAEVLGREVPRREITQSAFSQARKHLEHKAFIALNDRAVAAFYAEAPIRRWHGYRTLAVDGTGLRLPDTPQLRATFPGSKAGEVPQARLVELFDVRNGITLGAELSQTEIGEGDLAEWLLRAHAQPGDLLLFDRNFASFYLLALHAWLRLDYCMRCPVGRFNAVKAFVASGERERWVAISPCEQARRACERNGLGTAPIRVRLVRVDLPNGEVEVLITSLGQAIPASELAALYHLRWGIEEGYKLHKCRGELENFSGRTVRSVYQDVFAKLLSMNLAAMCAFAVDDQAQQAVRDRKLPYQINRAKTLSKAKHHLVCALLGFAGRLHALLHWIAADVEAVRPGRSFPRRNPGIKKPGFHPAYKRTA